MKYERIIITCWQWGFSSCFYGSDNDINILPEVVRFELIPAKDKLLLAHKKILQSAGETRRSCMTAESFLYNHRKTACLLVTGYDYPNDIRELDLQQIKGRNQLCITNRLKYGTKTKLLIKLRGEQSVSSKETTLLLMSSPAAAQD